MGKAFLVVFAQRSLVGLEAHLKVFLVQESPIARQIVWRMRDQRKFKDSGARCAHSVTCTKRGCLVMWHLRQ